jgi:hypothetical protein
LECDPPNLCLRHEPLLHLWVKHVLKK